MSQQELEEVKLIIARKVARGEIQVTRSAPRLSPQRKNFSYSMSRAAIRRRAERGVVIPSDGRRA